MYFYNARYYDSYLNRFLSPDTIIPDPANPQSLNRYSYVLNNPLKYYDPDGHSIALAVGLILLAAGGAGIIDWGSQFIGNMNQGMSWGEAANYKNLNWSQTATVAATAATVTTLAVTVVPAIPVVAGEAMTGIGLLTSSTALTYAGVRTATAGEHLLATLWTPYGTTAHGIMSNAQDRALSRLSEDTGESFTICGGYGESTEGIRGRAETSQMFPTKGQPVPGMGMPSWRNTGVPRGNDVDLWHPPSPQVEQGVRSILGFQGKLDFYSNYPDWKNHLPYASKTYFPDGSRHQNWAPWNFPE